MIRSSIAVVLCLWSITALAQLPNQHGQVWQEYDLRQVMLPPPNVKTFGTPHSELPMQTPTIIDIVKRETGEAAWSGPGFGLIGTDGQKLFVYNTPAVQQKVAETIGRFQRPETKNARFVMNTHFYSASARYHERMGLHFSFLVSNTESQHTELAETYVTPLFQYLRPILDANGQPVCKQPGITAYWVAKEDIPKFLDAQSKFQESVQGDRLSTVLQCPQLVAANGQLTAILDTTSKPFITNRVFDPAKNDFHPIITAYRTGQTIALFPLLSWDGKTVSSDFHIEFSATTSLHEPVGEMGQGVPDVNRIAFAEKGLVWGSDGMLVVLIAGPCRLSEGYVEAGVPIFNKIPFFQRYNTAVGREVQATHGIITVRMLAPNEVPQTAVAPKILDGNRVVR